MKYKTEYKGTEYIVHDAYSQKELHKKLSEMIPDLKAAYNTRYTVVGFGNPDGSITFVVNALIREDRPDLLPFELNYCSRQVVNSQQVSKYFYALEDALIWFNAMSQLYSIQTMENILLEMVKKEKAACSGVLTTKPTKRTKKLDKKEVL